MTEGMMKDPDIDKFIELVAERVSMKVLRKLRELPTEEPMIDRV